jgi:BirA family biotin operon repressor/biotin-[acetyl-CoA-carboxylase] ligase
MKRVLDVLRQNMQRFVSGEELAKAAAISRSAIWKQVNQLKKLGYQIEAVPHKGYCLTGIAPALHPFEIETGLRTVLFGKTIYYKSQVDSTNHWARELAGQGAREGTLVLAESQTQGKGRMGRSWVSTAGKGIWASLILCPQIDVARLAGITTLTAVAMAQAIFETTGLQVQLKWPNDLVFNGRKLAGILAECCGEMDRIQYFILGIGLNVNQAVTDFPAEIISRATSLKILLKRREDLARVPILQEFLFFLEQHYLTLAANGNAVAIDYARRHSATLGQRVVIDQGFGKILSGTAEALDDDGSLRLRTAFGTSKVFTGDIMKPLPGKVTHGTDSASGGNDL